MVALYFAGRLEVPYIIVDFQTFVVVLVDPRHLKEALRFIYAAVR